MKDYKAYLYIFLFGLLIMPVTVFAAQSSCPLGVNVTQDLAGILRIIKIVAPILVIGYTIYEGIVALTKGGIEAEGKKFFNKFARRVGAAVVLFAVPVLVDQMMQIMNVWDASGHCELEPHEVTATVDEKDPSKSVEADKITNAQKIISGEEKDPSKNVSVDEKDNSNKVNVNEKDDSNKVKVNEKDDSNKVSVSEGNNSNNVSVTDTTSAIKINTH